MLSPTERERLNERNSEDMDAQTRASNDARLRRKLATWLKEDIDDVYLILGNLPHDQLKRVLTDRNVSDVLFLASRIMLIRDFYPVFGDPKHPESWKVTDRERPANDLDITRAWRLCYDFGILKTYFEDTDSPNPIAAVASYSKMLSDPILKDRITEDEKKAFDRVMKAVEAVRAKEQPRK